MKNHSRASFRLFGLACLAFSAACGPALEGDEPGAIDPETGEYLVSSANQVDMNNLLSDADLMGGAGVTAAQVQRFLDRRGGPLKTYRDPAFPGQSAAQLIVSQSRAQSINPIYMLARIQTESSLISQNNSANLPKATGCGCPDGGGCNQSYRGFGKQIECSARMVRGYLRDLDAGRATVSGWRPGTAKSTSDPCRVTPANKATAALYTYTPWVGAYAAQCGRKSVGGSSLVASIYRSYLGDPAWK